MIIKTMFSELPKVMKSVLPKVSVQSVRSVWFLDVAWSDAFGVALSDASAVMSIYCSEVFWKKTQVEVVQDLTKVVVYIYICLYN